jgi:hypothetical protein
MGFTLARACSPFMLYLAVWHNGPLFRVVLHSIADKRPDLASGKLYDNIMHIMGW